MNEADKFLQEHLAKAQRNAQPSSPARPTVQARPSTSANSSYGMNARFQQQTNTSSAYEHTYVQRDEGYAMPQGVQHSVSMGEAIKRFWTNWKSDGRSSRSEYWKWMLINLIVYFILGFVSGMMQWDDRLLSGLWSLAIFAPSIAIVCRRLHDTGRSGGWFFISFIPFIGWIILWVLLAIPSEPHENQYGPVPNVR